MFGIEMMLIGGDVLGERKPSKTADIGRSVNLKTVSYQWPVPTHQMILMLDILMV